MSFKRFLFLSILILLGQWSVADVRIDYDLDDDGLIEINTLQDLNDIRNNVTGGDFPEIKGNTLYGSSDGCPVEGCQGYELTGDLDFDTNGNGLFDEGDLFWNEGKGWDPIGHFSLKFNAEFNGNGFILKNFVMNRPGHVFAGLFSYSEFGYFHDFSISADFVTGGESGGVLAYGWNTRLEKIHAEIVIKGENTPDPCESKCVPQIIGGIVGSVDESILKHLVVQSDVSGLERLGGVAGDIYNSEVNEIAVNTKVRGIDKLGGLSGTIGGSAVNSVAVFSDIAGRNIVSGLVGGSDNTTYKNILLSGTVNPAQNLDQYARGGGLIASGSSSEDISNVFSLVQLPEDPDEDHFIGAIVGDAGRLTQANVFWANDLANRNTFFHDSRNSNLGRPWNLMDLQCANEIDDCNGLQLEGFSSEKNSNDESIWNFGSNQEAPALILPMGRFVDADGDGDVDQWPNLDGTLNNPQPGGQSGSGGGAVWFGLIFGLLIFRQRRA